MAETLKFSLKGNRDYVQGTSLFTALLEAAARRNIVTGTIDVSFRSMIRNTICVLNERPITSKDAVFASISEREGESRTFVINEAPYTGPTLRQEFDEVDICRGAVVGAKCIAQTDPHHHDTVELLVALCKKMHQDCIDGEKQWVFSRYTGTFPFPSPEQAELKIVKQLGTRLTCTDVFINDQRIGSIYFS